MEIPKGIDPEATSGVRGRAFEPNNQPFSLTNQANLRVMTALLHLGSLVFEVGGGHPGFLAECGIETGFGRKSAGVDDFSYAHILIAKKLVRGSQDPMSVHEVEKALFVVPVNSLGQLPRGH